MSEIRVTNILGENGNSPVNFTQGINMSGIVTATSFVPTVGQLSHRNLVINGDMRIAQRATTSTAVSAYNTIDRMQGNSGGTDEAPTQAQVDVASGTTPYTLGFRKSFRFTNGNQTSGAGASDYVHLKMVLEAQDIANSGWNYTSSSSYITLSFWVKSSVAQDFSATLRTEDGTRQVYNMTTGSLTADTWTKITKTIPGNSNLQFDDNANSGLTLFINAFTGTSNTTTGLAQNTWSAWGGAKYAADMASTWYTTNDATFEFTGIQLEVGPVATPFEHRSYGDELQRCRRYYQVLVDQAGSGSNKSFAIACAYSSTSMHSTHLLSPEMRTVPTLDYTTGTDYYRAYYNNTADYFDQFALVGNSHANAVDLMVSSGLSVTLGNAVLIRTTNAASKIAFTAEL